MKQIYLTTALVLGTLFGANAQVVFSSSFENWASGSPTDWFGAKTNFTAPNAVQVTGSSMYGSNCVQLTNATTSHKRYTTQPLTVTDATPYEIKFWAKGVGDIRAGLFDGGPALSGYTYTSYVSVNTTTWTEYTLTLTSQNDTTAAEFILSVKATVAPDHMMVDSVVISQTTLTPTTTSIYDIQYATVSPYDSPYATQVVNTGGIVSAVFTGGYFIQSNAGAWNGLEVNDAVNVPAIGDSVTVTGTVQENFNNTRLTSVTAFAVVSSGNIVAGPAIITTTQGNMEEYEGVFAQSTSVCADPNIGFGMWTQYTAPDTLRIDDIMYSFTPTLGSNYQVRGVLTYSFSERKLCPRMASDVVLITGVDELNTFNSISLYPNPSSTHTNMDVDANATVNVFDMAGKQVMSIQGNTLYTAILDNGTYLVKITTSNGVKTGKLVVKH
ncbi:MAG TPA: T9SS type A sorting domain-containing protein [Flavobacteriales bacterium]|nr:T9SS type A sorting domain-containing protein [Flavobacteriales bacterium]